MNKVRTLLLPVVMASCVTITACSSTDKDNSADSSPTTTSTSASPSAPATESSEDSAASDDDGAALLDADYGGVATDDFTKLPEDIDGFKRLEAQPSQGAQPVFVSYSKEPVTAGVFINFLPGVNGRFGPVPEDKTEEFVTSWDKLTGQQFPEGVDRWTAKTKGHFYSCQAAAEANEQMGICVTAVAGRPAMISYQDTDLSAGHLTEVMKKSAPKFIDALVDVAHKQGFDAGKTPGFEPMEW